MKKITLTLYKVAGEEFFKLHLENDEGASYGPVWVLEGKLLNLNYKGTLVKYSNTKAREDALEVLKVTREIVEDFQKKLE